MANEREMAKLAAFQIVLTLGREPFAEGFEQGVLDGSAGRCFADRRPRGEHNKAPYAAGFALLRFCLAHGVQPYEARTESAALGFWDRAQRECGGQRFSLAELPLARESA